MLLRELLQGLSHLFYPHLCEGCSKPLVGGEEVLCIGCENELPETHNYNIIENETGLRFAGRVPFINAASYAYFTDEGLLQHLLHGLKYQNKQQIGTYLGRRMGRELKGASWVGDIDMIIPVPLHPAKLAKRGFNQSKLIAEGIGEMTAWPVHDHVLKRTRNTESQTRKSRNERVDNMKNAFAITDSKAVQGKHILLCDDVLTTGATLEACALALLQVPGVRISIATVGIAV